MKTRWTEWIFPTAVCIVFPVLIPLTLLGVLMLAITSAMKTIPGDER